MANDVKAFDVLLNGGSTLIGIDISDSVGEGYHSSSTIYLQADITDLPFARNQFDLTYSFATLEHVHNLESAWNNLLRVTKPGGAVYTVASPLWCHPYGHHKKNIFNGHPWVHLLMPSLDEMLEYCHVNGIESPDDTDLSHHISYMLNPSYFNMLRPSAYESAANSLSPMAEIKSWFSCVDVNKFRPHPALLDRGYTENELISSTHFLLAVKK